MPWATPRPNVQVADVSPRGGERCLRCTQRRHVPAAHMAASREAPHGLMGGLLGGKWRCSPGAVCPTSLVRRRMMSIAVAALLLGSAWLFAIPLPAVAGPDRKVEFVISDPRISESSGLATDDVRNLYWTINDAEESGVVYALSGTGQVVGTMRYDAAPRDAESIFYRSGRLYVGDTGGNREERNVVTVYVFDNPRPDGSVQPFRTLQFRFTDGPKDTEAILVDSKGRMRFITKDAVEGGVYEAPVTLDARQPNDLVRIAAAPQYVTDATYLDDGHPVLRSYVGVYVLHPTTFEVVASSGTPSMAQSESITPPLAGPGVLIGTEGVEPEVLRVPVPTKLAGRIPTITPPPSPTAVSSTPVSGAPAPEGDDGEGPPGLAMNSVYLGIGLMLAVGGGVAVFFLRRSRRTTGEGSVEKE